jgi:tRNA dimethylallyltransferase
VNVPLALLGATASGKTEASILVAERLDAEIVCVDSMLVYRGMDAGTAKPSPSDRARVPHHMVDLVGPDEPFSVARFQRLSREAVRAIQGRGHRALVVGGGGLYYRAVVDPLEFPGTAPATRATLETEAALVGRDRLHQRLAALDPAAAAKIDPANVRRTVRALEVAALTGRAFSSFAAAWERYPREAVRAVGIDIPRATLHRRIEARVARMLPPLLRETRGLLDEGFGGFLTSSQAIGYAEAIECLAGRLSEDEAATRMARRTKALARRQVAWFRRDPRIQWFPAGEDGAVAVVESLIEYLGNAAPMVDFLARMEV